MGGITERINFQDIDSMSTEQRGVPSGSSLQTKWGSFGFKPPNKVWFLRVQATKQSVVPSGSSHQFTVEVPSGSSCQFTVEVPSGSSHQFTVEVPSGIKPPIHCGSSFGFQATNICGVDSMSR